MQHPIEEIIFRSLTGTASPEELKILDKWRNDNPDNDRSYRLLTSTWQLPSETPEYENYQTLEQKIIKSGFEKEAPKYIDWSANARLIYKAAAAIVLICVSTWFAWHLKSESELVDNPVELVVTYNPSGQKSKITLPDNSVIFLNSESKVSYHKGFSDSIRFISLEGEAYFDVEPDANRPFVVETGGISTQALGTSFNIRNFPEENSISVSLLTGKVRVTDSEAANEVILAPFEYVAFDKMSRILVMRQFERDIHSTWKDGVITFEGNSYKHVIKTLERTYDVVFDTTQYKHTDWSYTGEFHNMSLEMVLTRIGYSEGFYFNTDGRSITIIDEK